MEEPSNGTRLSWLRDLVPLIAMVVAGLVWGMKLEVRNDVQTEMNQKQQQEIVLLQAQLNQGILPIAAERITASLNQ